MEQRHARGVRPGRDRVGRTLGRTLLGRSRLSLACGLILSAGWASASESLFQPEWFAPPSFAGQFADQLLSADLDGDGVLDLASLERDGVYWWRGTQDDFVDRRRAVDTEDGFVEQFWLPDIDGDGRAEILVKRGCESGIWVHPQARPDCPSQLPQLQAYRLDPESRNFPSEAAASLSEGSFPYSLAPRDIDGDGAMDLVAFREEENRYVWWPHVSGEVMGGWEAERELLTLPRHERSVFGDVDGDGDLDLFVVRDTQQGPRLFLYRRESDGSFARQALDIEAPRYLDSMDLNADGRDDLLTGYVTESEVARPQWYESTAEGFVPRQLMGLPADQQPIRWWLVDIDGDGDRDLLLQTGVLPGAGGEGGSPPHSLDPESVYHFDNSGLRVGRYRLVDAYIERTSTVPRLAVTDTGPGAVQGLIRFPGRSPSKHIRVQVRSAEGTWGDQILNGDPAIPALHIDDFDQDGSVDVLEITSLKTQLHRQHAGAWQITDETPVVPGEHVDEPPLWVGDYDADGDLDVAHGRGAGPSVDGVTFWSNELYDTAASFVWGRHGMLCGELASGDLGQFDRDNVPDLVMGCANSESEHARVKIALRGHHPRQGRGRFMDIAAFELGPPVGVAAADLDGDGADDVLVIDQGTEQLWFVANRLEAQDQFAAPVLLASNVGTVAAMQLRDLDGDGLDDIVMSGSESGRWMRNLGGAAAPEFGPLTELPAARGERLQFVDIDRDGREDAVLRRGGQLFWSPRGEGASFGAPQPINAGGAPVQSFAIGDLTADGFLDVLASTAEGLLLLRNGAQLDFGDAPAALYPTLLEQDGARHLIDGLALGQSVDADDDGQPSNAADGDDRNGDDEDGAVFGPLILGAAQATVTVSTNEPGAGLLSVFLDGNRDDDFDDAGEAVLRDVRLSQAEQTLSFALPAALQAGPSYARLRLSRAGGLGPGGYAASGEVEDHALTLRLPELRIRDAEVVEGDGPGQALEFALELEAPLSRSVSVGYVTRPESAQAQDFVPQEGRLTLTPGRTTHRIRVPVRGDTRVEGEETLTLLLRDPEGVALPRTQATGRIIDDDAAPVSPSPTPVPTASPQPSATPAPGPTATAAPSTTPRPTPALDGRLRDRRVAAGSVGLPLLRLVLGNPEAAGALLQVVEIDLAELDRPRPDVLSARLYRDAGESGVFDAADGLLATLEGPELSGDSWRFVLPTPLSIGAGAEQALMVVVDLAQEASQ